MNYTENVTYLGNSTVTCPFGWISTLLPQNLSLGWTDPWNTKWGLSAWKADTGGWCETCSKEIMVIATKKRAGYILTASNLVHEKNFAGRNFHYAKVADNFIPILYTKYRYVFLISVYLFTDSSELWSLQLVGFTQERVERFSKSLPIRSKGTYCKCYMKNFIS